MVICDISGKRVHLTKMQAIRTQAYVEKRGATRSEPGTSLGVYRCDGLGGCGGWHWGHSRLLPKKKREKRKG